MAPKHKVIIDTDPGKTLHFARLSWTAIDWDLVLTIHYRC